MFSFYVRVVVEITEKIVSISKGVTYVFNHAFISSRGWTNLFDVVHLKRLGFQVDWRLPSGVEPWVSTCTILAWRSEWRWPIYSCWWCFCREKKWLCKNSAPLTHEYSNLGLLSPASGSTLLCFCVDAVVQKRYLCWCFSPGGILSTGRQLWLASCLEIDVFTIHKHLFWTAS